MTRETITADLYVKAITLATEIINIKQKITNLEGYLLEQELNLTFLQEKQSLESKNTYNLNFGGTRDKDYSISYTIVECIELVQNRINYFKNEIEVLQKIIIQTTFNQTTPSE